MPLTLTVRDGESIQIGEIGAIRLNRAKTGRLMNMTFFMPNVFPIRIIPDGLIPARFTTGITGEPRRVPREAVSATG